ncbi:hypothetical protein M422DRAFT_264560 [Sphaerobolus stellatus SS14]|uniref:Uncharacterized protein n=1 Tax=Sphaerobolus stellatus (strain SS14) TaxID=990650 RepID=A0A0C9V842_SPHS4|nr:hypothetical protein M422DRAFT_264560 [Sphaerobolus stellatus SS14]
MSTYNTINQEAQVPFVPVRDGRHLQLATTHHYPSCSLEDLSEEELSVSMDPISQEVLRPIIQSEAANNTLKVAIAHREYADVTSFVLGQLHRFQTVLAQVQILRAAHYERLQEEDCMAGGIFGREFW